MGGATSTPTVSIKPKPPPGRPSKRVVSTPATSNSVTTDPLGRLNSAEHSNFPKGRRLSSLPTGDAKRTRLSCASDSDVDELSLMEPRFDSRKWSRSPSEAAKTQSIQTPLETAPKTAPETAPAIAPITAAKAAPEITLTTAPPASAKNQGTSRVPPIPYHVATRSFLESILQSPPRSIAQSAVTEKQISDAVGLVVELKDQHKEKKASLHLAQNRLSQQLSTFDPNKPVVVVQDALDRIDGLRCAVKDALDRLREAEDMEDKLRDQRQDDQIAVQMEHARQFEQFLQLGPLGAAMLFRILISAAGVHKSEEGVEPHERISEIMDTLDRDIAREQQFTMSQHPSPGRASRADGGAGAVHLDTHGT
ncbi:hypothetical protein MAPG_10272 [Magnaporthiopsis poae ATCC 64411]|uniref:Uncharacterized protein n=1 Tax=Magnaporthiopsis poae (strain ATCC 64411 / 73-15) TaxID=644358 RepID=A0A0C4EC58_MAGP6|nr:hypothetical protein MAPG_10272 [Magnaporthiopsis poae ATCC 64411]